MKYNHFGYNPKIMNTLLKNKHSFFLPNDEIFS